VKRQAEVEILPLAKSEQLAVIAYNPLAAGVLSGKYSQGIAPQSGRLAEKDQYRKRYAEPDYYDIADRFVNYAKTLGVDPVTLAISWVKSNPAITAPILGARNAEQLSASLAAADFTMTPEMREEISRFSSSPGTATDRLEEELDSKYILRNRI
jgi:aryl-alcohol dehydrogenase-like predicted oxidoreductase